MIATDNYLPTYSNNLCYFYFNQVVRKAGSREVSQVIPLIVLDFRVFRTPAIAMRAEDLSA